MAERYGEHPAPALASVLPHLGRVGATLAGIIANDAHTYGAHLSRDRLVGTGHGEDYTLRGAPNTPVVDDRAACAIDIGMAWPAAGEWLADVQVRAARGDLPQVFELIGDPDLILGPGQDAHQALYAAPSTGWAWVDYTGQGHVTWCHVAVGRRYANDRSFGDQLLGGWSSTGRTDDVSAQDVWDYQIGSPSLGVKRSAGDWLKQIGVAAGQVTALTAAVQALASAQGQDPAQVLAAVEAGAKDAVAEALAAGAASAAADPGDGS